MIPSQMLKGTLEGCILKVISQEATYGYGICEALKTYGFEGISEGTIYPLLLRLEKNGLVTTEHRESPVGPKRKYYLISEAGRQEVRNFESSWQELSAAVGNVLADREGNL